MPRASWPENAWRVVWMQIIRKKGLLVLFFLENGSGEDFSANGVN
jgi:hypothetical protein